MSQLARTRMPPDWRENFDIVRVLYRLIHLQTGESIARRGWRLEPVTKQGHELAHSEGLPIVLDDNNINPEEWQIVACVDRLKS